MWTLFFELKLDMSQSEPSSQPKAGGHFTWKLLSRQTHTMTECSTWTTEAGASPGKTKWGGQLDTMNGVWEDVSFPKSGGIGLGIQSKAYQYAAQRLNPRNTLGKNSVRENVFNHSKIRKKSCFFGFWKNVKNVKKTYRPLNHSAFNTQSPKVSTGKSPTSNILLRNADTRN